MNQQYNISSNIPENDAESKVNLLLSSLPVTHKYWYDINLDRYHPDFLILGPDLGLVVIEVKGWTINQIINLDYENATLKLNGITKKRKSPFKQAESQASNTANKINSLKFMSSDNMFINYSYIVAFPNISRSDYIKFANTTNSLNSPQTNVDNILFEEDFSKSYTSEELIKHLYSKRSYKGKPTQLPYETILKISDQIDGIIKISETSDGFVKLLDRKQAKLVKAMPDENFLIRGVAGSGKSIILKKRAIYLTKKFSKNGKIDDSDYNFVEKNVLLIVYNKSYYANLKNELDHTISNYSNFEVARYDDWIKSCGNKFYDYIIIDEAQDMKPDYMTSILSHLNSKGKVLIAYDGAQNVYERDFDFKDFGITFKEENIIELNENYRNSREVIEFGNNYFSDPFIEVKSQSSETHVNKILTPASHYQPGKIPELYKLDNISDEIRFIKGKIDKLLSEGVSKNQIAIVLFSTDRSIDNTSAKAELDKTFDNQSIYILTKDGDNKDNFNSELDKILVSTPQSIKGLEFDYVFICQFFDDHKITQLEKSKIYVAITRAIKELVITTSRKNNLHIEALYRSLEKLITTLDSEDARYRYEKYIHENFSDIIQTIDQLKSENRLLIEKNRHLNDVNDGLENSNQLKTQEIERLNKSLIQKNKLENTIIVDKKTPNKTSKNKTSNLKIVFAIAIVVVIFFAIGHIKNTFLANFEAYTNSQNTRQEYISLIVDSDSDDSKLKSTYIENISEQLREIMPEGFYQSGTKIDIYSMDGKTYLKLDGNVKVGDTVKELNETIEIDSKLQFKLCNNLVKVKQDGSFTSIDNISDSKYITKKNGYIINFGDNLDK